MSVRWEGRDRLGELLVVREADAADAGAWLVHIKRIVAETPYMLQGPSDPVLTHGEQQRLLESHGKRVGAIALIAERPGRGRREPILGTLTLTSGSLTRLSHSAELSMGVMQVAWGRGVGDALIQTAVAAAREDASITKVSLQVFASNTPAIRLYTKYGFVPEGRLHRYARVGAEFEDIIPMGLWLGHAQAHATTAQ